MLLENKELFKQIFADASQHKLDNFFTEKMYTSLLLSAGLKHNMQWKVSYGIYRLRIELFDSLAFDLSCFISPVSIHIMIIQRIRSFVCQDLLGKNVAFIYSTGL